MSYLFQSNRLGFKIYDQEAIDVLAALNEDEEVMRYFTIRPTYEQTEAFALRMNDEYEKKGYCYFAVDRLDTGECIGFIGLLDQNYEAPFTPCTDIGWRLAKKHWYNGFATEGAKACLKYAFEQCELTEIYSTTTKINTPSINVMKKIGMKYAGSFIHPRLIDNVELRDCDYYYIKK